MWNVKKLLSKLIDNTEEVLSELRRMLRLFFRRCITPMVVLVYGTYPNRWKKKLEKQNRLDLSSGLFYILSIIFAVTALFLIDSESQPHLVQFPVLLKGRRLDNSLCNRILCVQMSF